MFMLSTEMLAMSTNVNMLGCSFLLRKCRVVMLHYWQQIGDCAILILYNLVFAGKSRTILIKKKKTEMDQEDLEQECPFCGEPWGECVHYDVLVGLEQEGDEEGYFLDDAAAS